MYFCMKQNIKHIQLPRLTAYTFLLHDIDSVNVFYNLKKHTNLNDSIFELFYSNKSWLIRLNKHTQRTI